ncbi:MAG: undecaprenyl-diphosphate phosphatase [Planctomycetia bacterium]|nr:undecaprenyl-diphosphate phosphatase [Planctomycetia bacterium]
MLIVLLAIVQGVGEFLPISSSGHTLVLGTLLHADQRLPGDPLTLTIILHSGTLLALLVWFRRDLESLMRNRAIVRLVCIACIPTALLGLLVKYKLPDLETNLVVTGVGFLLTAALLFFVLRRCQRRKPEQTVPLTAFSWPKALLVGLVQGFAVLPGLSRSGWTITSGAALGLDGRESAIFSFLISIPVLAGVLLLETLDLFFHSGGGPLTAEQFWLYLLGATVSFLVGLTSLNVLMKQLASGRLYVWSAWLVLAGLLTLCLA